MDSPNSTLEAVLGTAVSYMVIAMSNLLIAVRYFYTNYPETARIASMAVAAYILFKSFMRIVRLWWGMLKFVIKAVLLFSVVIIASCAYYRGPHRFFTRDLPFVYNFWQSVSQKHQENIQNIRYADILGKTGLDPAAVKKSAAGWIAENAEQIDTLKTGARDFASENIDHIQKFVRGNNLQNFWNLGFANNGRR
ncbi:hypothetical protein OXX69_007341 [Metschnikowia pulcherrima]